MTILNTNVVSELMRPAPDPAVSRWFHTQAADDAHITVITVAEILYGIEFIPHGKRRDALHAGAERMFGVVFSDRILAFAESSARAFSLIAAARRKRGRPMSELDAQIAAITRASNATLATRNISDFEGYGVKLAIPGRNNNQPCHSERSE